MVAALGDPERQVLDLKAERFSFNNTTQALRQKPFSAPHKYTGEKPSCCSAVVSTDLLGKSLQTKQRLAFWLEREVGELFF